ncbi:CaiD Enoyl-CoA hydratase carnithine racemase [Pyrenophora tritici-repentis]|nr:mitochondrial methylglutaconyl-hydratase protein [Pyrenophora tritici-repentis]KAF7444991.1 mitochondrial methylglutaconyl-hydratase protein [Pyrenophora tritici-repentis]KAF7565254.1 CaiD, Enoyl-CoA hydratase-carnithine racemase [Pyrenophora tritici-repentis]KAI1549691.1 CaiD Enoyl-CoA hydratase carnithine racemase [Pyrenophora tritici-repentis]KAI1567628.1 CaiD Enoyl-CoA hydratase carnithine racemase [Pyrenophora tritici-repentis]
MLLLGPTHRRIFGHALQARTYATASAPAISVTNVPAPHCGSIRILSLNRPAARNAISRQLLAELSHQVNSILDEGDNGSTRALILASEVDSSFCAGADLKERATFTPEDTANFLSSLRGTFASISQLPIPTISALAAPAFGGGLELALTTHLRIFASSTTVALPETRLAILPGAGGTYRLPALIGLARARDLILTGRRVAAPEAYFLGLCDRLVEITADDAKQEGAPRKKVLDEAIRLAREICEGGPIAIKAALAAVEGCALGEQAENAAYDIVVKTKDRDEALLAFREKRKPVFKGE